MTTGFARNTVMGVADTVISAVKSGAIKHFFLVGGCDGAKPGRNYYTDLSNKHRRTLSFLPWPVANIALMTLISEKSEGYRVYWTWGSVMMPILLFR